jgi:hypothetical protein
MQIVNVIRDRLTGPTTVELDEPAPPDAREAEVWLRVAPSASATSPDDVFSFLRGLPPGSLTKAQIDARMREERIPAPDR